MHNRTLGRTIGFIVLALACAAGAAEADQPKQSAASSPATLAGTATENRLRGGKSRKAALRDAIRHAAKDDHDPVELQRGLDEYLADRSVPVADRYDVRFSSQQVELGRAKHKAKTHQMEVRARHARQLVTEFPSEDRAYFYFLQVAAAQPPDIARKMADEIMLDASAPSKMKTAAARIAAQCEMLGQKLSVVGLDSAQFKGRPLVIYTWSVNRLSNLETVKQWTKKAEIGFIAINVDADSEDARKRADSLAVPGVRYYEPLGLDGPLASQLRFTSRTSVYIVDQTGVLIDVKGFERFAEKIAALTAGGEASR